MSARFTWVRHQTGMLLATQIYELRRGGVRHAIVQQTKDGDWFSYGTGMNTKLGWNTYDAPTSLEDAKADALARARAALRKEERG